MKILTNAQHKALIDRRDYWEKKYRESQTQLQEARDMKTIFDRLTSKREFVIGEGVQFAGGGFTYDPLSDQESIVFRINERDLSFVQDMLENDVIVKEKSTKVVFLDKEGNLLKQGYTKKKADKGYNYKLVRE